MPSAPPDFDDLSRELDRWGEEGRAASLWWRDDDATAATPELTRLLALSDAYRIEVALAVIPAPADDTLGQAVREHEQAVVLQHGYAHKNHARPGEHSIELGGARPVADVLAELDEGRVRLYRMFPDQFVPVVAAPWNNIERPVLERLAGAGFRGASAYGPRAEMHTPGLTIANAHVDPVNWRKHRFAGNGKAVSGLVGELKARRTGATDGAEPLGLLTHHLIHDVAFWSFLDAFFSLTTRHAAARWIGVEEAFAAASPQRPARLQR